MADSRGQSEASSLFMTNANLTKNRFNFFFAPFVQCETNEAREKLSDTLTRHIFSESLQRRKIFRLKHRQ